MTAALIDTCKGVLVNATHSFARFGRRAEPSVSELINLLKDEDKYVCISTARALASIVANLITDRDALLELSQDTDVEVHNSVAYALRRVNASESV